MPLRVSSSPTKTLSSDSAIHSHPMQTESTDKMIRRQMRRSMKSNKLAISILTEMTFKLFSTTPICREEAVNVSKLSPCCSMLSLLVNVV